jgi:hypothetical protein
MPSDSSASQEESIPMPGARFADAPDPHPDGPSSGPVDTPERIDPASGHRKSKIKNAGSPGGMDWMTATRAGMMAA